MFGMSLSEIAIILIVSLVVLGPEKLPQVARTAGKFLREVRKAGNLLRDSIMLEDQPSKLTTAPATTHAPHAPHTPHTYADSLHHSEGTLSKVHEFEPAPLPTRFPIPLQAQRMPIDGQHILLATQAKQDTATATHALSGSHEALHVVPLHIQLPQPEHTRPVW